MRPIHVHLFLAFGLAATCLPHARAGTVFDYRFDGGPAGAAVNSLVDSGPNALNGTASGLVYTDQVAPGGSGFALDARGDFNFAAVASSPLMALQSFTLSLQARPDAACTGPSDACFIAVKKNGESGNFLSSYGLYYTAGGQFVGEIGYGNGQGLTLVSSSTYAIGSGWHDLALVLDRDVDGTLDRASLFVNGQLQATQLGAFPTLAYSGSDFVIGAGNFLGSASSQFRRNFNGAIDNVRLEDVALPVPEPAGWALMLSGLWAVGALVRRRRAALGASAASAAVLAVAGAQATA